jgi:hypothetical protein
MNKRNIVKKRKIVGRLLLLFFSLLIGVLVLITILQESSSSKSLEERFQSEQLKTRCHQIDVNCFYFDAFDKELVTLLKAFKNQHPELQINGIFRSGNGTFVIVSSKEQKN